MSKFSNILHPANRVPRYPFVINRQSEQARNLAIWIPHRLSDIAGGNRALVPATGTEFVSSPFVPTHEAFITNAGGAASHYSLSDMSGITSNVPLTLSFWYRRIGAETGGVACYLGDSGAWNDASYIDISTYVPRVVSAASTTFDVATGTTVTQEHTFYLITGVWESTSSRKIYVNGYLEGSDTGTKASGAPEVLSVGADWSGGNDLDGAYSDLRIWTRALSAPEVWALYDPATRYELYQEQGRRVYGFAPSVAFTYKDASARLQALSGVKTSSSILRSASARLTTQSTVRSAISRAVAAHAEIIARSTVAAKANRLAGASAKLTTRSNVQSTSSLLRGASVRIESRASVQVRASAWRAVAAQLQARSGILCGAIEQLSIAPGRVFDVPYEQRIFRVRYEDRLFRVPRT